MKCKLKENIPNSFNFCSFVSCNFQQTSYALAEHCIANCFNNLERCRLSPTFPLWICVPQHGAVSSEASNQKAGKLCPDMGHRKSQQNASYTRRACCPYFRSHTHTSVRGVGTVRCHGCWCRDKCVHYANTPCAASLFSVHNVHPPLPTTFTGGGVMQHFSQASNGLGCPRTLFPLPPSRSATKVKPR